MDEPRQVLERRIHRLGDGEVKSQTIPPSLRAEHQRSVENAENIRQYKARMRGL